MRPDSHTSAMEIGHETLFRGHLVKRRPNIRFFDRFEQRTSAAASAFYLPERIPAVELSHTIQSADFGEQNQFALLQFRYSARKIIHTCECRPLAFLHDRMRNRF